MNQPVRSYPLRPITEPAVYVSGEKMGQKFYNYGSGAGGGIGGGGGVGIAGGGGIPPGPAPPLQQQQQQQQMMHPNTAAGTMPPMPMMMHAPHTMLAQQNSTMEVLERRRERERVRDRAPNMSGVRVLTLVDCFDRIDDFYYCCCCLLVSPRQRPPQTRVEDDDSADEAEHISTRTLALTRYKRNHELMDEVFRHAAFGALELFSFSFFLSLPSSTLSAPTCSTPASGHDSQKKGGDSMQCIRTPTTHTHTCSHVRSGDKKKGSAHLTSPYSIFDQNEMEAKMVRPPFVQRFLPLSDGAP